MSDIQIGELYLVKEFFWFLFPTKELARRVQTAVVATARYRARVAWRNAKWLSQEFKCNVSVVEPNTCVVLLEEDENFFKVLDSNGNIGWIRCRDFSDFFELVKE
jgi:hypothetical protein